MIKIKKTDSADKDFIELVALLDESLKVVDGNMHSFYHQYNGIQAIKYAIVAYENGAPVGCGAIKQYDDNSMEIKRMYVNPTYRKQGIAELILLELENWAKALNKTRCILETGNLQIEALGLYSKNGYQIISNYGQYEGVENSICFQKIL
jgi:GNAT superfamily N-acetyltransferase